MSDYDDSNRAFLQAFLSHNVLTFETARPILAAIFSVKEGNQTRPQDVTEEDFRSYVSAANTAVSPLDFEVRSTFHQKTRTRYYALVNTTSDALTQLATTYSPDEVAYIKKLLDRIFETFNTSKREAMCIMSKDAVNIVREENERRETQNGQSQIPKLNLSLYDAESIIERLIAEGWLEKSSAGFLSLSPRALMELKGWLVETYNEPGDEEDAGGQDDKIKFCHACKEIVTIGQRCADRKCPCRLHDICIQSFFRTQASRICPVCKTAWDGKHYVGEKAITTSESYLTGKRRSGARPRAYEQEDDSGGTGEDSEA